MILLRTLFRALLVLLVLQAVVGPGAGAKEKPRKCIMVFGAHADDVEEMAGGTLAKYIAEGYQGVYVCVVNNFAGNQIEKVPGNYDFTKVKVTGALSGSPRVYQVDALETCQIRSEE